MKQPSLKVDILTLFPKMFSGPFDESIVKRAINQNLIEINIHDLRSWGTGKHKTVDDRPFGGGTGMILMIEPIFNAIEAIKSKHSKVILTSPSGTLFNQSIAKNFSKEKHLIIIAGHYEGYDNRIKEHLIDQEISIGEYILTGGELPAMVIVDSIARLVPGVLKKEATQNESFTLSKNYKEHPQYTRPEVYNDWPVPKILLSGNHSEIENWKKENSKS